MAVFSTVCITGANRGLGLEFVRQMLSLSSPPKHIFALCRDPDKSEALTALAKEHSARVHVLKLDITDVTQYDDVVRQVREVVGSEGLNLLINNAGIFNKDMQGIESQTKEELMRHFEVNTVSPILVTQAFLPLLKEAAKGPQQEGIAVNSAIVFISSKLGCFFPNIPKNNPYRYSKAALNMAVHCLAKELESQGVLVTAVHPGWVKTDMGGHDADHETQSSVSDCLKVILGMGERNRGKLYQYDNTEMAW